MKGSVRFNVALEALKSCAESYGSNNVCIPGHSLGAGFALQMGKALAKEGIYVEKKQSLLGRESNQCFIQAGKQQRTAIV